MKGGSEEAAGLKWIQCASYTKVLYWLSRSFALRFGDSDKFPDGSASAYRFGAEAFIPAIFDSGTSAVVVPKSIAEDFFGKLLHGHRYV